MILLIQSSKGGRINIQYFEVRIKSTFGNGDSNHVLVKKKEQDQDGGEHGYGDFVKIHQPVHGSSTCL